MKQKSAFGNLPTIPPDIYPQKGYEGIYFQTGKNYDFAG